MFIESPRGTGTVLRAELPLIFSDGAVSQQPP
jgi:hypothetical protein